MITDPNGLVVDVNAALLQMTGYTKAQLVQQPAGRLYLKDAQGNVFGVQWTLFRNALKAGPTEASWRDSTIWLGHAAVTSATHHYAAERFARGGVGQACVQIGLHLGARVIATATQPERLVDALVWAGTEAIQRNREAFDAKLGHGVS